MTNRLARGFFHRDLSGYEAEKLLRETNLSGCFLVRPSRRKQDAYVLSVRRATGDITHMLIQRTNEGFDLGENQESFSTLYDMIDHYRRNPGELRENNHEVIELTSPVLAQLPTLEKYYHGCISHARVLSLLNQVDKVGSFLVRESETSPGDYVLCVKTSDDIANIKIKSSKDLWYLYGVGSREQIDRFKSLDELIHFYLKNNVLVALNGISYRLEQACISTWFYAYEIHQRCEQLSKPIPSAHGQKTGFSTEFELLNQQSESQSSAYHKKTGEKQENRSRNRFKNILPYDETRVVLKNYSPTDYMNGNRIRVNGKEYIATQGPLPSTVNDFWHLVQQGNVKCIVMITREMEGPKNKCARYWPDPYTTKQYGTVTVENLGETNYGPPQVLFSRALGTSANPPFLPDDDCCYRLRSLRISTEDRRTWDIAHCQYLAWGDHDSPYHSNQRDTHQLHILVDFFEKFSRANEPNAAPMIVHCSAGIGRSGATIAIDLILHRIKSEGLECEIDIPNLIKHIRSQRSGLVQTERQYELIYRVIEYYVSKILHLSGKS